VLFQLRNIPNEVLEVQKLRMDKFEFETGVTQLDLALDMVDKAEGLSCVLKYNTDLFDAETIKRMGEHFQTLLEGIVAAPNKPISAYSLVTPQSLQLLPDPSIPLPEPPYELATTLFTYWVNRTPKQIAVSQNNYLYTYSELYERAHSLANALLNQGLERGDVVAVFGSRCFGMITSIIGVFFSGGVLLTLENNLPSYRQQLMLREH
jgi:non-ribosomal peptide synthetase component F